PLAKVLLEGRDGRSAQYPPAFRRFVIARMTDRLGRVGVDNLRRELAGSLRTRAPEVAVRVLLEGDLVAEAVEFADREVDALRRAGRVDAALSLVRLLPAASVVDHPHLQELERATAATADAATSVAVLHWRPPRAATSSAIG